MDSELSFLVIAIVTASILYALYEKTPHPPAAAAGNNPIASQTLKPEEEEEEEELGENRFLNQFERGSTSHFTTRRIPHQFPPNESCPHPGMILQKVPGCADMCTELNRGTYFLEGNWDLLSTPKAQERCPGSRIAEFVNEDGTLNFGMESFGHWQVKVRPMVKLFEANDTDKYFIGISARDFTKKEFHYVRFMGGAVSVALSQDNFQDGQLPSNRVVINNPMHSVNLNPTVYSIPTGFTRIKSIRVLNDGFAHFSAGSGYVQLLDQDETILMEIREGNKLNLANDGHDMVEFVNRANETMSRLELFRHAEYVEEIAAFDSDVLYHSLAFQDQATSLRFKGPYGDFVLLPKVA